MYFKQFLDERYMTAIESTNRGAAQMPWAMLTASPVIPEIDVDTLESRSAETMVVDVREPEEYEQGHVPGAIHLPRAEMASRLDELPHDRPLALICRSGVRSLRAAQFLRQVGFEQVMSVQGGTLAWRAAGKPLAFGEQSAGKPRIIESAWAHAGVFSPSKALHIPLL
jgi:rhodanese-related sulfurtransferase